MGLLAPPRVADKAADRPWRSPHVSVVGFGDRCGWGRSLLFFFFEKIALSLFIRLARPVLAGLLREAHLHVFWPPATLVLFA